jgi:hypothetical protein
MSFVVFAAWRIFQNTLRPIHVPAFLFFVQIVEMAALLYLGDTVQARHLYRRYAEGNPPAIQQALDEWWSLGRAMTECNMPEAWARLTQLQQQQPKPYCDYAHETGTAMCRRLEHHRKSLLGDAHTNASSKLGSENTTAIIAFLESPTLRI